jgi:hypothetical protein
MLKILTSVSRKRLKIKRNLWEMVKWQTAHGSRISEIRLQKILGDILQRFGDIGLTASAIGYHV